MTDNTQPQALTDELIDKIAAAHFSTMNNINEYQWRSFARAILAAAPAAPVVAEPVAWWCKSDHTVPFIPAGYKRNNPRAFEKYDVPLAVQAEPPFPSTSPLRRLSLKANELRQLNPEAVAKLEQITGAEPRDALAARARAAEAVRDVPLVGQDGEAEPPKAAADEQAAELLYEAEDLLRTAWGAMLKLGLNDRGSDCCLAHEVRMFALDFSNEGPDGTGKFRAWRKKVRAAMKDKP